MALRFSSRRPILCAVLDAKALMPDPKDTALALFRAGVDWVQFRDRSLEASEMRRIVCALVEARDLATGAEEDRCRVIVNRRVDVVLTTGADGAHLGFDGLDPGSAASLLPRRGLIGVSLHSQREVELLSESALCQPGLDGQIYVHLAPIWEPSSKPVSRPALGLDLLSRACRLGLPVLAQGGLDPTRATEALRAGAIGIAVTGILTRSGNPVAAAQQLRQALDGQISPAG